MMKHEMVMTAQMLFVGGRTKRYYQAKCSCGVFASAMESSRMHAVGAFRKHVAGAK